MTDRHKGYIVALDHDVREDDAEYILNAIRMIKGVIRVEPVVEDASSAIEQMRLGNEMREKLYNFVNENLR